MTTSQSRQHHLTMYGIREDAPGARWQLLFESTWPAYRRWYASGGLDARPDLATCRAALRRHMPELVSTWERLAALAGDDEVAARMLSLWDPPAFEPGCAQLVLHHPQRLLIRNYDYSPALFEQVVYSSRFARRRVIGTGDCLCGLLDGMNDDGLAVSFTYGGRPGSGRGFGISLVVRYLLEVCATVQSARALRRSCGNRCTTRPTREASGRCTPPSTSRMRVSWSTTGRTRRGAGRSPPRTARRTSS